MFEIAGKEYYFDLNEMSKFVRFENTNIVDDVLGDIEEENDKGAEIMVDEDPTQMIDVTKWEMIRGMVETILQDQSIIDDKMGIQGLDKELSIPVKLSFNTLIKHNIIKSQNG